MKKKGARDIPDFSSKRKPGTAGRGATPGADRTAGGPQKSVRAPTGRQAIKPQGTSSKSGRRGS